MIKNSESVVCESHSVSMYILPTQRLASGALV